MLSWKKFDLYPSALPTLSKVLVCRTARDHVRANLLCGNRKILIQCPLIWRPMGHAVLKALQMGNGSPNWA